MKRKINLDDPRVKSVRALTEILLKKASEVPTRIENAVVALCFQTIKSNKPQLIGSGVVFRIKNYYFIFSASHI